MLWHSTSNQKLWDPAVSSCPHSSCFCSEHYKDFFGVIDAKICVTPIKSFSILRKKKVFMMVQLEIGGSPSSCDNSPAVVATRTQCYITFYDHNLQMFVKKLECLSLTNLSRLVWCFRVRLGRTQAPGQGPSITHKHWTRLERLSRNQQSSLLCIFINYGSKRFKTLSGQFYKTFLWL
jgi:hypothetical protein